LQSDSVAHSSEIFPCAARERQQSAAPVHEVEPHVSEIVVPLSAVEVPESLLVVVPESFCDWVSSSPVLSVPFVVAGGESNRLVVVAPPHASTPSTSSALNAKNAVGWRMPKGCSKGPMRRNHRH